MRVSFGEMILVVEKNSMCHRIPVCKVAFRECDFAESIFAQHDTNLTSAPRKHKLFRGLVFVPFVLKGYRPAAGFGYCLLLFTAGIIRGRGFAQMTGGKPVVDGLCRADFDTFAAADTLWRVGRLISRYIHLADIRAFAAFRAFILINAVAVEADRVEERIECAQGA